MSLSLQPPQLWFDETTMFSQIFYKPGGKGPVTHQGNAIPEDGIGPEGDNL